LSPAAARTSNEAIIVAARALLETGGPDAVTMQAVADAVGVRAPSLYKRVADRSALLTALADDVAADLARAVASPAHIKDPARALRQMALRYRAFAHRSPRSYQLLFGGGGAQPSPGTDALASAGILRVAEALVGPAQSLEAARLLVAFAHGFVSMELAGAFRLGGNVNAAFDYGVDKLLAGLMGSAGTHPARD
jgi:AcrR family transcriptional regulator